jgi:hypothetical protein
MDSNHYKDFLILLETCLEAIGLPIYKDFMSKNKIFMAATIIHNLQGFHIHYGMYMMAKRLEILLLFFFIIL